ncbi:protein artichoke-like [Onthophagus taurus]|uniref:protein artichoke-like n=1 Tax=Onthophagus taurus TaxID=166361 RepID=UPI0039BDD548
MKIFFFLILHFSTIIATYDSFCEKTFIYHRIHGYGYDINCEKLTRQTFSELSTTAVFNPIKLRIKSSNLHSIKWHISNNLPSLKEIEIVSSNLFDSNLFFEKLNDLKILIIENSTINVNSSGILYSGIHKLINLNKLVLDDIFLKFLKFNESIFSLEYLNLDNNLIENLNDINFSNFPSLETLSLKNNKIQCIGNGNYLNYLKHFYLDYNNIDFINLDLRLLITLTVSFNKLKSLNSLGKMEQLEYLNLEGNYLESLTDFSQYKNLKYINLRGNKLRILGDNIFSNNHKLSLLNLNNNQLININLNALSTTELDLSNNQIKSIDFVIKLRSLKKLDLSFNKISDIPNNIFKDLDSLTFLNLSFNPLKNNLKENSFYGLIKLLELDLSNTKINELNFSNNLISLIKLNVSNNNIANLTGVNDLYSLKILNISYNHLFNVQETSISNLKHLIIIDFEGNHLKNIEYVKILSKLTNLQILNIKNNSLPCEVLDEMIAYFKNNSVNFTVDNKFNYDKENVAGIYCKQQEFIDRSENLKLKSFKKYNLFLILMSLTATFAVLLVILYAIRLHIRRRRYICDTVQLLDR